MTTPCLVLVDGEHYPPVTRSAIDALIERGFDVRAAFFLGGAEKTVGPPELGVPMERGEDGEVGRIASRHGAQAVLDLSDEPIVGYRRRMRLAGHALRAGLVYQGADFRFDPPPRPHLTDLPSVAVIGTGKRTGKTAVSIELARHWRDEARDVCIVTMGRGGPPEPVTLLAGDFEPTAAGLRELAERGFHAASDYVEDAVFAGVDTIGTRRCGAGLAGGTMVDNFADGLLAAGELGPELLIMEGSGTAIPPARVDATVLVMLGNLPVEYVTGYLGPYRLALADAVVILEHSEGHAEALRTAIGTEMPDLPIFGGSMRPEPTLAVSGKRVALVTTAPPAAAADLVAGITEAGAVTVSVIHSLGDRTRLGADLDSLPELDALLVELKAAAVDVVLPWAQERGVEFGLVHNQVIFDQDAKSLASVIEERW